MPARSSASTSSRVATSTCAIASFPAGTSGSSSSTASSGSTSSSTSIARQQEDLGVEPLRAPARAPPRRGRRRPPRRGRARDRRRDGCMTASASAGRPRPIQSSGSARRLADPARSTERDRDRLRALCLGVARAARVLDADDDRDPVSLGDSLAEASWTRALLGRSVLRQKPASGGAASAPEAARGRAQSARGPARTARRARRRSGPPGPVRGVRRDASRSRPAPAPAARRRSGTPAARSIRIPICSLTCSCSGTWRSARARVAASVASAPWSERAITPSQIRLGQVVAACRTRSSQTPIGCQTVFSSRKAEIS